MCGSERSNEYFMSGHIGVISSCSPNRNWVAVSWEDDARRVSSGQSEYHRSRHHMSLRLPTCQAELSDQLKYVERKVIKWWATVCLDPRKFCDGVRRDRGQCRVAGVRSGGLYCVDFTFEWNVSYISEGDFYMSINMDIIWRLNTVNIKCDIIHISRWW